MTCHCLLPLRAQRWPPVRLCPAHASPTRCLALSWAAVTQKWRGPEGGPQGLSQPREECHALLMLSGPREMSFQATVTRRVNRKVNSSQCPWPVRISDDWDGSKWKWNHRTMTRREQGSQTAGQAWEEGFALIQHTHGQVMSSSELWGQKRQHPLADALV